MRAHNQIADPAVAAAVYAIISTADGPITRDVIVDKVHVRLGLPRRWSLATSSRRVREAFRLLNENGSAVISEGKGYRIAKTQAELDAAAARLYRQAMSLLKRQAAIRKLPLEHVLRQIEIDWGEQ